MLLIYQVSWKSTTSGENPLPGPHDLGSDQREALGIKSHRAGLETHCTMYTHVYIHTCTHALYYVHHACIRSLFSHVWLFATHMDCSLPGSSVHGTLQARMLEWVAIPFSRGSTQPKDQTRVSCIAGKFFAIWDTREARMFIYMIHFCHLYTYMCVYIYCTVYTYTCMLHAIYAFAFFFFFCSLLKMQSPGRNFYCFAHCRIPSAYNGFWDMSDPQSICEQRRKEWNRKRGKGWEGRRIEERKRGWFLFTAQSYLDIPVKQIAICMCTCARMISTKIGYFCNVRRKDRFYTQPR